MLSAQLDLAAAVLDIGSVVLGEELDFARRALEAVMLFEGRQQNLADQPGICPSWVVCIARMTPTGSVAVVWYM